MGKRLVLSFSLGLKIETFSPKFLFCATHLGNGLSAYMAVHCTIAPGTEGLLVHMDGADDGVE